MFPMGFGNWMWDWGWGWAAGVGVIILLGVFLLPWFFFLLNLQTLLNRVSASNRAMPASHVWLNFIPLFNLGWFIYTVSKVRDSVRNEYQTRGWPAEGDFAYNVGLATGILAIAAFFVGWVPVLGWAVAIAELVCWIIYWLKTSDLKNRLGEADTWRRYAGPPPYGGPEVPRTAAPEAPRGPAPASPGPAAPPPAASAGPQRAGGQPLGEGSGQVKLCGACGAAYDSGDKFCRTCGLRLP